jgi:Fe-S oxidoreductase
MTEEIDALLLDDELHEIMREVFGHAAQACFQCGACTATCPWGVVSERPISIRELMRRAQLGIDGSNESVWLCTDCGQCVEACPRSVPIPEVFRAWRGWLWKKRDAENGLPAVLWSIYWNGNSLSQPPSDRMNWAEGLNVPMFDPAKHEYLLFVGCTASYDPRAQKTARALVRILKASNCAFGVLGIQERCCGECVLRLGHQPYFEEIAEENTQLFRDAGVRNIITISPHCYDAFKNHYPSKSEIKAIHYSEYLREVLYSGNLELKSSPAGRLSFHDPCLLSRANPEFNTAREVLACFNDLQFDELEHSGEDTICCGGGGGRMFLETLPGERFSDLRIEEAITHGTQKLITTCPLCISCLEDSRASMGVDSLEVVDLAELISSALEPSKGD